MVPTILAAAASVAAAGSVCLIQRAPAHMVRETPDSLRDFPSALVRGAESQHGLGALQMPPSIAQHYGGTCRWGIGTRGRDIPELTGHTS